MAAKLGIAERSRELQKAIAENVPNETLLAHLQAVQSWVADEDTLRTSKIGRTVNNLRVNKMKETTKSARQIAELAAKLVNKWKSDVRKPAAAAAAAASANATMSPAPNGVKKESAQTGVMSANGVSANGTPVKAEKSELKPFAGDQSKRTAKADGVKTDVTETMARNRMVEGMYKFMAYMTDTSPDQVLQSAIQVELQLYTKYGPETNDEYKDRAKTLMRNLKENDRLRSNVLSGSVLPSRLVEMTAEELKSDEIRAIDRQLKNEVMNEAMVAPETRSISTLFKCGKCGHDKTYHYQVQTRSADEPMTNFLECVQCGNEWRFS